MKKDGYVFFSIPAYNNWNVYIDGEKADKLTNANITFMAAAVGEGEHDILLKHEVRYEKEALAVSIAGLVLVIALDIIHIAVRRRKEQ